MKDQDSMRFPFLVNSVCAALLGLTMNLLLFFLITKRTPTIMKPYSRIMRIHCLSDVAYDTVCFITGLYPTPLGGHVFCLWQGFITRLPLLVNHLLFSCWYWVLLTAVTLLPVDFYYRYMSVCHNKELSSKQIAILVFFAYFVTWLHTFPNSLNYMVIGPTNETIEYSKVLEQYPQWKHNVPSFAVTVLGASKAMSNYVFVIILNIVCYTIVCITAHRINQALKQNANINKNTKALEIQKQVSKILVLQFVLPLLVVSMPMSVIAVLGIIGVDMPLAGAFSSGTYYWLSAVKPVATIMIVKAYREYVSRKIVRPLLCLRIGGTTKVQQVLSVNSEAVQQQPTDTVDNTSYVM